MGKLERAVYTPIAANADRYDELFAEYTTLHDYFGRGAQRRDAPAQADPP